jgi:hypothetical protein
MCNIQQIKRLVEVALTGSLAAEYDLHLVYKKSFSEILAEEQTSRDFGPLLAKMGVLDAQGASNMDEDQWEAASKSPIPYEQSRYAR